MTLQASWNLLKDAAQEWIDDKAPRLGAALAYYAIFSLAPLIVIVIGIVGLGFSKDTVKEHVVGQLEELIGKEGEKAVLVMVESASEPSTGIIGTVLGTIMLIVGAMGLFGQLQDALNTIWQVQPRPGRGILALVRERLLSFTMIFGVAFLLLISLIVSAGLAALAQFFGEWRASLVGQAIDLVINFAVISLLFAMIYRYLPDVTLAWRDVWVGALVTTALFLIGKLLIGLYLGHSGVASGYGAAGSLAVLLIWLYYSAQIFLFGAELTKVWADRFGSRIVPAENAMPASQVERAKQGNPLGHSPTQKQPV